MLFFGDEVFSNQSLRNDENNKMMNIFFVLAITMLDFIKELNCGYYHCGEVVVDRRKIMLRYLRSPRIYFDTLAFFSLLSNIMEVSWASIYVI